MSRTQMRGFKHPIRMFAPGEAAKDGDRPAERIERNRPIFTKRPKGAEATVRVRDTAELAIPLSQSPTKTALRVAGRVWHNATPDVALAISFLSLFSMRPTMTKHPFVPATGPMTMKLYHIPGSCSLFPHIVALELGIPVDPVRVFYRSQTTEAGEDYSLINPMGYVPSLGLDDGTVLREAAVIAEYLADSRPQHGLVPAHGSMARYRLHEWLAFIGTEIHKGFQPLLQQAQAGAYVDVVRPKLFGRFAFVDLHLQTHRFLMGEQFSIADAYLFTVTRWGSAAWMGRATDIDLTPLNHLRDWFLRVNAMPSVQEAVAFSERR